ncbi:MAG: uL30 family ribosomal protein [Candidatus Woesearchaeota archaeon]
MATEKKQKIAAILVRGIVGIRQPVKETLKFLRLNHKNHCVVLNNTPINQGMIKKVKDYITWGEIDEATFKELVEKRGEEYLGREKDAKGKIDYSRRFLVFNNKKYKKYFRLNPPRKGFGLKGIKMPFKNRGALGYRGEKIKDLIERMI